MPCKTPPPRKLTRFKTASWDMAAADDLEGSAPITPWAERTVSGTILIDPADQEPQPEPTPVEQLAAVPEPASEPVPAGNAPPAIPLVSLFAVEGELTLTEALGQYLTKGEIDWSGWDEDTLTQLGSEVTKGEAVLGIDDTGSVKRVVSVAKPVRGFYALCGSYRHHDGYAAAQPANRWSTQPTDHLTVLLRRCRTVVCRFYMTARACWCAPTCSLQFVLHED